MNEDKPIPIQHIMFNRPLSGLPAHLLLASKHSFALKVLHVDCRDVLPPVFTLAGRIRAKTPPPEGAKTQILILLSSDVIYRFWNHPFKPVPAGACPRRLKSDFLSFQHPQVKLELSCYP